MGKSSKGGFKQIARRPDISSNWRMIIDMSPEDSVNDSAHSLSTLPDRNLTQEGDTRFTDVSPVNTSIGSQKTVRGENDSETLRAIAEDRCLYVGNMPYFAKVNDVQHIFEKDGYEVYVGTLV